jgi:hypothetical protein
MTEELVFFGTASNEYTIWKSNGTSSGTAPLINASVLGNDYGQALSVPGQILLYANDKIYAGGQDSNLLVWDGQGYRFDLSATTVTPQGQGSVAYNSPQGLVAYGGRVYFNGSYLAGTLAGTNNDLFSTNGNPGGTTQISYSNLNPGSLTVAFGKLFFSGLDPSSGNYVLWSYDGGTLEQVPGVDVVNPQYLTTSPISGGWAWQPPFAPALQFGGNWEPTPLPVMLFMSGQEEPGGPTYLWRYDGSNPPIQINPTSPSSSSGLQPYDLVSLGWQAVTEFFDRDGGTYDVLCNYYAVCFSGVNAQKERGLWTSLVLATNDTAAEVTLPSAAVSNFDPFNLTPTWSAASNGKLYFTGYDDAASSTRRGLFVYDPRTNQAKEIINSGSQADLDAGFSSIWEGQDGALGTPMFNQTTMIAFNSDLYFSASGGTNSSGLASVPNLWRANLNSEGTGASPTLVNGLNNVSQNGLVPFSLTTADL